MHVGSIVTAALLAIAVPAAAQDTFHWTGKLAAGKRLEIKGISGDIHAVGTSGGDIEVTGTKHANRSDPESVEIKVVESENGVTICALYPTGRHARHPNECIPGDDWSSSSDDNDVSVDFEVRLPATVKFLAHTVNGSVEAEHLGSDVWAYSVNGGIRVSTMGYVEATTVNGSISASLGRADWSEGLEFRTVNGGISLDLPASFSAEVSAETLNGDLISDFPLTVSGRFGPRHLHGTIGKGGRELSLHTVNGTIRLRKAGGV